MPFNGIALGTGLAGVALLWGALVDISPLTVVKDWIKGVQPTGKPVQTAAGTVGGEIGKTAVSAGAAAAEQHGTPGSNKALGLLMAGAYGWAGPGEWPYLESGWEEESGWNQFAANDIADPYNHAYGIPQANPGTKMASAGGAWKTSPAVQIRWGLKYIKDTYGSPSQVPGWTPGGPAGGYKGY